MSSEGIHDRAVELLQQLGLSEYEAAWFVTLAGLASATAKEVSDESTVPRTRVYDAMRVLESQGLVEVQHAEPQRFRAVPVAEAVETLRRQTTPGSPPSKPRSNGFTTRGRRATRRRRGVVAAQPGRDRQPDPTDRRRRGREVVLVVGTETVLSDDLFDALADAEDRGVTVVGGALDDAVRERVERAVPDAEVFVSDLEWLRGDDTVEGGVAVGRLLLVDGETILVSSFDPRSSTERAVFGHGFSNGLVLITRRLMETGLIRDEG